MDEKICPKCGASLQDNQQYCPHCGAFLSTSAPLEVVKAEAKPLSPKTKKTLKLLGISLAGLAAVGITFGILIPLVFVPNAKIQDVRNGNVFEFTREDNSYSVKLNYSLEKYFEGNLPSELTIPSEHKGLPVASIGDWAFANCSSLTSITIPDSVTSIGDWAFENCSSLASITIPDSVTSIGSAVFGGCSSLTSVTIPDGVTSINNGVFGRCSSLASITIPDSVTSIDAYAFKDCSSLTSVTIGNGVASIGGYVFENCSSLTSITFNGTISMWNSISKYGWWNDNSSITVIYCTDGDINL